MVAGTRGMLVFDLDEVQDSLRSQFFSARENFYPFRESLLVESARNISEPAMATLKRVL